jgi:hypothetical protein
MYPIFNRCEDTAVWMLRIKSLTNFIYIYIYILHIQGVSGEIVNILGDGSMDYSE